MSATKRRKILQYLPGEISLQAPLSTRTETLKSQLRTSAEWLNDLDRIQVLTDGHDGCINAMAWNEDGSLLISGSDDHRYKVF